MELIEREVIKEIKRFLDSKDIIVLHGARQVGKTSILKYLQNELKNNLYIDLEDLRFVELLNSGTKALIDYLKEGNLLDRGLLYLFIDEIQYLNNPTNFLKLMHDHYGDKIKLVVSGSSSFGIKSKFKDSLVGRTINFEIHPLNFKEFLLFKGYEIDLNNDIFSDITINELAEIYKEYILYGGYPRITMEKETSKKEYYLQQIIDTYIRKDIRDLANIRDILKFNKLLETLASQSGQLLNVVELSNTAKLARPTVENYLFIMENTYILKLLHPFSKNLRSELFKTPKVFFYDTGIANLLWLKTLPKTILGNMFETSVFSELIKNRENKELFFWRTQDRKEIDFIIRRNMQVLPVEVKLTQSNLNYTSMSYFMNKYNIGKGLCVSLYIEKRGNKNITFCYPWETHNTLLNWVSTRV